MSLFDNSNSHPLVINFNSKDRISGSNSSFFNIPTDLGLNMFDSVCLVSASIPKSFYNMPTGYNTFSVKEGLPTRTITIPVGNYTKNNLLLVLATQLNTGGVGWVYTVSYTNTALIADTYKITFSVTGNSSVQPIFTFQLKTSPFRQLGFDESSVNTFVGSSLSSSNAINLSYILRAFIKSNICRGSTDSILEELLNIGSFPSLSVMYYQQFNFDMNTREFNTESINSWQFSLVDSYDNLIDLNNISWAFSVVFYQRNNTHQIHKADLQIKNEERIFNTEVSQRQLQNQLQGDTQGTFQRNTFQPMFPVEPSSVGIVNSAFPNIIYPK